MSKKNKDRGDRLRKLRELKGWEQKDLGDKIDVHFSHISKWEGGAGISRKHLINLASALETTIDFIETGKENENTNTAKEPISKYSIEQLLKEERSRLGIEDIPDDELGRAVQDILDDAVSLVLKLRRLSELNRKRE